MQKTQDVPNCFFSSANSPKPKAFQYTAMSTTKKQQILDKLVSVNVLYSCLKNYWNVMKCLSYLLSSSVLSSSRLFPAMFSAGEISFQLYWFKMCFSSVACHYNFCWKIKWQVGEWGSKSADVTKRNADNALIHHLVREHFRPDGFFSSAVVAEDMTPPDPRLLHDIIESFVFHWFN